MAMALSQIITRTPQRLEATVTVPRMEPTSRKMITAPVTVMVHGMARTNRQGR